MLDFFFKKGWHSFYILGETVLNVSLVDNIYTSCLVQYLINCHEFACLDYVAGIICQLFLMFVTSVHIHELSENTESCLPPANVRFGLLYLTVSVAAP